MKVFSPIRSLDARQSRRHSIDEEQEARIKRSEIVNHKLEDQIYHLRRRLYENVNTEQDVQMLLEENDRLKFEVNTLNFQLQDQAINMTDREMRYGQIEKEINAENGYLTIQNEELKYELAAKKAENEEISRQKEVLQENYQTEINFLKSENADLKKRLMLNERDQINQIDQLKRKYTSLHMGDSEALKTNHHQQIKYLIAEIDKLKGLLNDKSVELQLQFEERKEIKARYDTELASKIGEINQVKNQLVIQESEKNKEIKQLMTKKELERSRAAGIMGTSKQSTQYLQGEIKKLTEQLSLKNNEIENLNRRYLVEKKKNEDSQRDFNEKLSQGHRQNEQLLRQKIAQYEKRESILKEELLYNKKKETELYMNIDKLHRQIQVNIHEYGLLKESYQNLERDLKIAKSTNDELKDEHLKEINKIMNDKLKRRSSRMLSSRSLNSSEQNQQVVAESNLPVVKQEVYMRESKKSSGANQSLIQDENQQQNEFAGLIAHYQTIIEENKKSNKLEIELLNIEIDKLKKCLSEKQQENLDILNRFSPLVKIRAGEKSLEQDRRERIDRHWKADIELLNVLLSKNKIQNF